MKKILLITTVMSGYEKEIINALEKKNFDVTFFPKASKINKKEISFFHRILRTLVQDFGFFFFKKKLDKKDIKIYEKYIEELDSNYDYIFDFGGKSKEQSIKLLKDKYDSEFVLYMWDDLKYAKTVWDTMKYFDRKYIFNNNESLKSNFLYRSNFFVNSYRYNDEEKIIDIFYKGSLRDKKRTFILEKIEESLEGYNLDISLYAKGNYLKNRKKVHSREFFEKKCNDKYMSVEELVLNSKHSKVLLDIAYKNQSGLGLRPLEAIASNCKLITTNKNIKSYDFYNSTNIFCLEEDLSNIDEIKNFVDTPFESYSDDIKYKYSVDGFIDDIFGVEK